MRLRKLPSRASAALVAALIASCSPEPVRPHHDRPFADGVTRAESLAFNAVKTTNTAMLIAEDACTISWLTPGQVSGCALSVPSVTPQVPWLYHSGGARDEGEIEQRLPIHIRFPEPVRGVMLSSTGALKCTGTLGRIVGFRNSVQVAEAANVLIDPADCGDDDVTYGVQGSLPPGVDLDGLVVEGVDPWTFEVMGICCGRARLNYTIQYQPGPSLSCDVVMRGQTATCRVNSVVEAVAGWEFDGELDSLVSGRLDSAHVTSNSTASNWSGIAVLAGQVLAFVSVGGALDTLQAPLTVSPRSGAEWGWSESKWTLRQDGTVACSYGDWVMNAPTPLARQLWARNSLRGGLGVRSG